MTGYEKAWGSKHKQPLDTRYNLALLYKKKGQFKYAIKHFELVMQGYIKVLGPYHWETVEASEQLNDCKPDQ